MAPSSASSASSTGVHPLLRDRRVAWVLASIFALVGVEAVLSARWLHDEGLVTWYFASLIANEPIAALFLQKARPAIATLYAPLAVLGFRAFAIAHVLVAAAAIPLLAAVAERLGQRCPNVPALVFASSPLVLMTAPGGQTNLDAAVGLIVALWLLLVRRNSLAAGAVLGALLLIRSEIAPFVLAIAIERALAGDRRVALGVPLVPGVYALAGIPYHRDLLWFLHYPPAMTQPVPGASWFADQTLIQNLGELGDALFVLTPAWLLLLFVRPRALRVDERGLAIALLLFLIAIRGFPLVGLFNFDTSERYLLVGLPALAMVVGRVVDDSFAGRDGNFASIAALLLATGFGVLTALHATDDLLLIGVGIAASSLALQRCGRPHAALAAWLVPLLVSAPLWLSRIDVRSARALLEPIERTVVDELGRRDAPIVTNVSVARAWFDHRGLIDEQRTPVHYIMQRNMVFELDALLHAEVGQREAILRGLDRCFYGRPIAPPALVPEAWPPGTLVILQDDDQLAQTLDLERWQAAMTVVLRHGDLTVARLEQEHPTP